MKIVYYTAEELSEHLRIPRATIYHLTRLKQIPAIKIGKHWRFRKATIEKWMSKQEQAKPKER